MSALLETTRRLAPLLATAASCLGLAACDPAPSPREFWRPWYELPRSPEEDGGEDPPPDLSASPPMDLGRPVDSGADGSVMPGSCALAITVTTTSAGGRYSPRNIGAIWISDGSDRFVKTVAVWADKRSKYLKKWNEVTAAAGTPGSRVDAISSATKTSHGVRSGSWNCTSTAAMRVPDGAYKVCFELTDYDGPGPNNCVPFSKSPAAVVLTPADSPSFTARRLEFSP